MDKLIGKILEYVEPDCAITGDSLLKTDCGEILVDFRRKTCYHTIAL